MKRGTDWGSGSEIDVRDEEPQGPMAIEPLTPQDRHRQLGWRVPVGLFVTIALLALAGHALELHETATSVAPPSPTPIAWVNAIVSPAAGPAESATQPGAAGPNASPSTLPAVAADAIADSIFWTAGKPNHFTVRLTNTSAAAIPLTPCPTYVMFVSGTPANLATIRAMNCADMGTTFAPGETLALDMVYTPSATDPLGIQSIEWEAISGFTATARITSVEIEG